MFWPPPLSEDELHVGLGLTTRKNTEFVLLARRGNARPLAKDVREPILSPVQEHSRKPEALRDRIERYCAGPYAELFARSERPGWASWGDEVGKFPASVSAPHPAGRLDLQDRKNQQDRGRATGERGQHAEAAE